MAGKRAKKLKEHQNVSSVLELELHTERASRYALLEPIQSDPLLKLRQPVMDGLPHPFDVLLAVPLGSKLPENRYGDAPVQVGMQLCLWQRAKERAGRVSRRRREADGQLELGTGT